MSDYRLGWSAARMECRGRPWMSARELSINRDRWAVTARCDRGFTRQLPDLAVWVDAYKLPCALIVDGGGHRDERQKMILEGWRDAIHAGRYARVQYDCASPSVVHRIRELAKNIRLSDSAFSAIVQPTADQITALSPATPPDSDEPAIAHEPVAALEGQVVTPAPRLIAPLAPVQELAPESPRHPAQGIAERERLIREPREEDMPRRRRRR
jgi:hypothetical protein